MSQETIIRSAATPQATASIAAEDNSMQKLLESDGALGALLAREHLTELDFILGHRYFTLLLKHVTEKQKAGSSDIEIRYGELVERLRREYAGKPYTEAALPVNIGRRLYATQRICELCGLPNLTGAVVNGSNVQGRSYKGNWAVERQAILDRNWEADQAMAERQFDIQTKEVRNRKQSLAGRLEQVVRQFYYKDVFCKNRELLTGRVSQEAREEIIALLLAGVAPEEAVFQVAGVRIAL
jgi:hypothetical protein